MALNSSQRCGVGAAVGIVRGVVGARFLLVGSWLNLVPWSVAGAALGARPRRVREATLVGAAYGFGLGFAFMIAGYAGAASLVSRLAPFLIIGAIGALCGAGLAALSASIMRRIRTR